MFYKVLLRAAILLSAVISCVSSEVFAETHLPGNHNPLKVSDGVAGRQGAVAWSKDGKRIAFIRDGLFLYDVAGREQKRIKINEPYYLSWGSGDSLFVLFRKEGRKALCRVAADSLDSKEITLEGEPEAVFPVFDDRKLLILSSGLKATSIGMEASYRLMLLDIEKGTVRTLYESSRILPTRNADIDYVSGWVYPGTNPFDTTILTMEFVKPPAFPPYLRIGTTDYVTGKAKEIGRVRHKKFSVPSSWSPDGMRLALPDEEEHLKIIDMAGGGKEIDNEVFGTFPAWNPKGSQIFFGGYLLSADGKKKEELISQGRESVALWSPDGTKMALLFSDELWLLDNFRPSLIPPDRTFPEDLFKKVLLLKELLREGLLTETEYEHRHGALLKEPGGPQ